MRWMVVGVLYAGALGALGICALGARKQLPPPAPACPSPTGYSPPAFARGRDGSLLFAGASGDGIRVSPTGSFTRIAADAPELKELHERSADYKKYNIEFEGDRTEVARHGGRRIQAHTWIDHGFSMAVSFDGRPGKLIAARRLVPYGNHHCGWYHSHRPLGQYETLRSVGSNWLYVTPDGFVTFDDEGRRLDGCPGPTVADRLAVQMPAPVAFMAPWLVWLAVVLGALAPFIWLASIWLLRRKAIVVVHALAWAIAALFALTTYALPLLT